MSRKTRHAKNSRDAPVRSEAKKTAAVFLSDPEGYKILCGDGYRPLSSCPEVQTCISAYAEAIANMTLHLMINTEKGDKRIHDGLSRQLDIEPNRHMTHQTFFENIVRVMMTEGNQVTIPVYEGEYLRNLIPVKPSKVTFREEGDDYRVVIGGVAYSPDEVLHFPINPDPERPYMGLGFRVALSEVVKSLRQTAATKNALMESPMPSLIVKVDGLGERLQTPEGREELTRQYIGETKGGRPWMIPAETMSIETVKPLTLNDLAIKTSLELDKRSIAAIIGVPAFLVGIGSFDAKEYNWFISTKVMRVARIIQQELTRKILVSTDRYWRFNPRSLMSYDIDQLISAGKEMVDRMAMRRNEWRDWVGFEPDEEMDELLALENFVPANRLGDQKKLKGGGGEADEKTQ